MHLKHLQHTCTKKTDETLGIDACNIHVQPLQHMHVTPSLLHPKSFTKTCHEHHVYV